MNSDEEENNFSFRKNDINNNIVENNQQKQCKSFKTEIKRFKRRKSVNVNEIKQMHTLSNPMNLNIGKNDFNHTLVNYNIPIQNKNVMNNNLLNINSFRNDLSVNNTNSNKTFRRNSLTINNKNNILNQTNINNNINKSMYNINMNNVSLNRNISFNYNNKSMYINRNNISMNKIMVNATQNKEYELKYRVIARHKELYDSLEDEEVMEEQEEEFYFISPETHRIFIFDTILLFCMLFCSFYYPLYIAQSICFCSYIPNGIKIILFITDFLNIFDILISFFRAYYNFEFVLIKKNEKIVKHYLKRYFIADLITALPVYTCSFYFCKKYKPDGDICFNNGIDFKYNTLKILLGLKVIKLFKVFNKKSNRGINYYYEKISENYTLEKTMKMLLFSLMVILGFNIFICYHIYIGRQNYPNWIIDTNNQDKTFINLYLISLYFLITTITSVGYGDITCVSIGETVFQIILLTIGVIAYSWVISTIGNYVKKETRAAIKYNKDMDLLEEIRISYPKMSFKLYTIFYIIFFFINKS
jgi:hypothetical protein